MFKEDSYIKSIEKYFLNHLGKGIMLSYSDYELIQRWKDRQIPYEVIIEGISNAFSDSKNFDSLNNKTKIRNLGYIISYIDKSIEIYSGLKHIDISNDEKSTNSYVDKIISKIGAGINHLDDDNLISTINSYKENIASLKCDDHTQIYALVREKELELYNRIFNLLSQLEKNTIIDKAKSNIKNRDNMTQEAYDKSITSFRNMLIKKRFNLEFLN